MATRTGAAGGGNWNSTGSWVEGAIPTNADDVVLNASSGNITIPGGYTAKCLTLDCTGYTGTLAMNAACQVAYEATPSTTRILTLVPGMTFTYSGSTANFRLNRAANGNRTVAFGGKVIRAILSAASITLDSDLTAAVYLTMTEGFDTNGYAVVSGGLITAGGVVALGASSITCVQWDGYAITSLSAGTSTITLVDAGAGTYFWGPSFYGAVGAYHNIAVTAGHVSRFGSATYPAGSFTANSLAVSGLGATTITFMAGSTINLTGSKTFPSGSSGNVVTMQSSSDGASWAVTCSSGTVSVDHVSLKDSAASGGASFEAGVNSTDVSGNSGWTFAATDGGTAANLLLLGVG